jgi:hypothetical protein
MKILNKNDLLSLRLRNNFERKTCWENNLKIRVKNAPSIEKLEVLLLPNPRVKEFLGTVHKTNLLPRTFTDKCIHC